LPNFRHFCQSHVHFGPGFPFSRVEGIHERAWRISARTAGLRLRGRRCAHCALNCHQCRSLAICPVTSKASSAGTAGYHGERGDAVGCGDSTTLTWGIYGAVVGLLLGLFGLFVLYMVRTTLGPTGSDAGSVSLSLDKLEQLLRRQDEPGGTTPPDAVPMPK